MKFTNFVYICITFIHAEKITIFEQKVVIFTTRNTNRPYIQNLRTSQGYIFFILQHLPTHLCSFTHSKTLFLAVVLDFVLDLIKILSIAGITHCYGQVAIETRKLPRKLQLSISQVPIMKNKSKAKYGD